MICSLKFDIYSGFPGISRFFFRILLTLLNFLWMMCHGFKVKLPVPLRPTARVIMDKLLLGPLMTGCLLSVAVRLWISLNGRVGADNPQPITQHLQPGSVLVAWHVAGLLFLVAGWFWFPYFYACQKDDRNWLANGKKKTRNQIGRVEPAIR